MADEYTDSGVPVLRGVNVNRGRFHDDDFVFIDNETADRLSKFESFPSDVLLVHKGTLGQIGLMPTKRKYPRYIMGNSMMRVRCDPTKLLSEYLYYWLTSADGRHYLFSRVSQVGVPQIQTPLTTLREAELPVPPLPEQCAIAHILGTLDDKIELNHRMNETLEAIARAIFKSWFVDFDPVRAKASGEAPESICRRLGLTPELLALFPSRLVDSALGEIPDGWEVRGLDAIASLSTTSTSPGARPNELFEHYSIPAFDSTAMPAYELGSTIKSNKYVVSSGAVLVSKLNPETSRIWLPSVKTRRAICSTEFMQFVPLFAHARTYLYLMMCSKPIQAEILKRVTGSTGSRQRAQPSQIATLPVPVPPESLMKALDALAAPILEYVDGNRDQTKTLAVLRDTLLPKLLSGELRVPVEDAA